MKNSARVAQYVIFAMLLVIIGCVSDPVFDEAGKNSPQTRTQSDITRKFYYAYNEKIYIDEVPSKIPVDDDDLKKHIGIKSINSVYKLAGLENSEMYLTDEFMVKWNNGVSQQQIEEMHEKYSVKVVDDPYQYLFEKTRQLLSVPTDIDVLDVANAYQESGLVIYSHPNFIVNIASNQTLPSDPYFISQYYLHNTGQAINGRSSTSGADINAPQAWAITKGNANIVVAVLDSGVSANHPDLPASRQVRLPGSDFVDGDGNPSPTDDAHGTGCAGIIAASHNNEGVAGVAPNCKIMPVRILGENNSTAKTVAAIRFAVSNGADIISNSWGFEYKAPNPNQIPEVVEAIRYATTSGRGGRGCVVVFSAGNDNIIGFPANVEIPGVITVGASDRNDMQAMYSATSDLNSPNNQIIDVVAPSRKAYSWQIPTETHDVWTTDIPGVAGYNPVKTNDNHGFNRGVLPVIGSYLPSSGTNYEAYTGHHGGTSAACPQVAGVAALILSMNPALTQKEVADIIMRTARKARPTSYNYRTVSGMNNGLWSNEMGYGVVDAYAALQAVFGEGNLAVFSNRTVRKNTFFGGDGDVIWSNNVTVRRDASLTLQAPAIVINEPFTVEAGATFVMDN